MDQTAMSLKRLRNAGFHPRGILDIGAHDGKWALMAREIFPASFILMVDALEAKDETLSSVATQIGNADYRIAMLGERDEAEKIFHIVHGDVQTGSSYYPENTNWPKEQIKIKQTSLRSMLKDFDLNFELAKLDVQGAEIDILSGAKEYLGQTEAVVMEVSTLPYNEGAPLAAEVISAMRKMGFVLFDLMEQARIKDGYLLQFDAMFIREHSRFRPLPPH